jgi:hypothetical protein
MTPNKFSIEPDSGPEPRCRSDFVYRREGDFRLRWRRPPPRLQAYVHSNRLNRRIFLDVPFARHANLRGAVVKALVMWQGARALLACATGSSVAGVISLMNRSEKIVDHKIRYLAAQTSAAGKVGAEMHAGENAA